MNEFGLDLDAVVRILVAVGLGAAVGFEREANDQAAGLRTHISVALGACVFGVISTLGFEAYERSGPTNVRVEVTRVASQVVVGIGFIGAGLIYRHGATVRNLTTAASLWVTAAIGLAVGVGVIGVAIVATLGLVLSLVVLRLPRRWIRRTFTKTDHEVAVRLTAGADPDEVTTALRSLPGLEVKALHREKSEGRIVLRVVFEAMPRTDVGCVLGAISDRSDITDLETTLEREPVSE